jgi:serine/threonine-protein kinase RsbW/sigma-B regulation protein RsbU (phosphoserine phosphatase)
MESSGEMERLIVRSDLEEIPGVQDRFTQFVERHRIVELTADRFRIALDEVLNNIVTHAYPGGGENVIEIFWNLSEGILTLEVTDEGVAFDPLARPAPDTTLPLEERDIGGLGIHIVRTLMDEVLYERREGRNILTMIKRVDPVREAR